MGDAALANVVSLWRRGAGRSQHRVVEELEVVVPELVDQAQRLPVEVLRRDRRAGVADVPLRAVRCLARQAVVVPLLLHQRVELVHEVLLLDDVGAARRVAHDLPDRKSVV